MKFYKKHKAFCDFMFGLVVCLLVYLIPITLVGNYNAAHIPQDGTDFGYALGQVYVLTGSFIMIPFSFISAGLWKAKGPARAITFIIVSFLVYFGLIYMISSSCFNSFNYY